MSPRRWEWGAPYRRGHAVEAGDVQGSDPTRQIIQGRRPRQTPIHCPDLAASRRAFPSAMRLQRPGLIPARKVRAHSCGNRPVFACRVTDPACPSTPLCNSIWRGVARYPVQVCQARFPDHGEARAQPPKLATALASCARGQPPLKSPAHGLWSCGLTRPTIHCFNWQRAFWKKPSRCQTNPRLSLESYPRQDHCVGSGGAKLNGVRPAARA